MTASQFCCVCCKRCLSCDGAKWWTMIPALHRLGASGHVFLQPLDTGQLDRNHNAGIVQSSIILGIIHCGDVTDPGKHHHVVFVQIIPSASVNSPDSDCLDTGLPWPVAPALLSLPGSQQPPPGHPGPELSSDGQI